MIPVQLSSATASNQPSTVTASAKLQKTACEFEAQLLAELLRDMHFDEGILPGSESSGANEQYQNMATQAVADAMSSHGGIGISKSIMNQLHMPLKGSTR